jgi:sugar lactone lactonase YvrE
VVVSRFKVEGFRDLTAIAFVPALERLAVVADHKDRLLLLTSEGGLDEEIVLPGLRQEGLAFDALGDLWIADDRGGLLRFAGALQALRDHRSAADKPREAK